MRRRWLTAIVDVVVAREPPGDRGAGAGAGTGVSVSASPQARSRLLICYRTMPATPADARLRPDLRLGLSDAGVRRVAALVRWVEEVAGIA